MCGISSKDFSVEPFFTQFERLRGMVELEFEVEEGFIEYETPTFYVELRQDSKEAFLRLVKRLGPLGFIPILRRKGGKIVLQIASKPPVKPSRRLINIALLFATIGTMLLAGYVLSLGLVEEGYMSNSMVGAMMFAGALMAILVSHEMGHKLSARRYGIESTAPYFIPGPPPPYGIGTFGAIIQQKSLVPNKDALFDLGASGPIMGLVVTIIVTIIGVQMSYLVPLPDVPEGAGFIQLPLLFQLFAAMLLRPLPDLESVILMHPIGFAGWVGMLLTMLNLIPAGTLDGGHAVRGFLGPRARKILSFCAIMALFALGYVWMAMFVIFISMYQPPGPLDDVSKLTTGRKLVAIVLASIFVLCAAPL